MSKKNQTEVVMTERQKQEAKEAQSVKRMTFTFVTVIVLCLAIFVGSVVANPIRSIIYRNTTAVTVGEHKLSAMELNYFYVDAISTYYNQYSSIIKYMLDVSKPLSAQVYNKETNQTYADFFVQQALDSAKSSYALYNEAMAKGFKLSEEQQKTLDSLIPDMEEMIEYYSALYESIGYSYFKNANEYLKGIYGIGANTKTYEAYYRICYIADCYYSQYAEDLKETYNEDTLRAYENGELSKYESAEDMKSSNYTSYSYHFYQFKAADFLTGGTKGDDGKYTYTDEEKQASIDAAKALADAVAAGEYEDTAAFDKAINAAIKEFENSLQTETSADETEGTTAPTEPEGTEPTDKEEEKEDDKKEEEEDKNAKKSTEKKDILGKSVESLYIDWLAEEGRAAGNMKVFEVTTGEGDDKVITGYTVVRVDEIDNNTFKLVNVRHILLQFEGGKTDSNGNKTYTDAEKEATKKKAQELLDKFLAGTVSEDAFAELAKKESKDTGSASNGGLYEDVYPGQMVTNFNDWCFDEARKVGDTGLVETEYGYHIMYFSGWGEQTYRDFLITNDILNEDLTMWHEALVEAITGVIVTDKHVDKDITMSEVAGQ